MEQQTQETTKGTFNLVLIGIIALLVISNGAMWYLLFSKDKNAPSPAPKAINNYQKPTSANKTAADKTEEPDAQETTETTAKEKELTAEEEETIIKLAKNEILVDWYEWPKADANLYSLFDYDTVQKIIENDTKNSRSTTADFLNALTIYKLGTIKEGQHKGQDLYIITFIPEGPSVRAMLFRIIKNDKTPTLITKHSDNYYSTYKDLFTLNDKLTIANLDTPKSIQIPNSKYKLIKTEPEPFLLISTIEAPQKLFKYDQTNYLYKDASSGCFFTKSNDSTIRQYYFHTSFIEEKEKNPMAVVPHKLDIIWDNGKQNEYEYFYMQPTGCGRVNCYNYTEYITSADMLQKIGKTATGEAIYELKNKNLKEEERHKKSILQEMYDLYYQPKEKISFDEFLSNYPLIYWQDPFGDFIEFRNAEYIPMAECGKPVIYLYPEEETDVSVWVAPTGGFSITEPAYNNGWRVKATPQSEIYNYEDKTTYPYLFWEGKGVNYKRPEKGFVVEKEKVKNFLEEKLAKLGLIQKEYDEFIEFWLPKMQEENYYFITFVPKEKFDNIAPLEVFPKPDTVIRVFMDYQGLNEPIAVEEQKITTPVRDGFTVVEWGGALNR